MIRILSLAYVGNETFIVHHLIVARDRHSTETDIVCEIPALRAWANRLTGAQEDGEDLIHDTIERALVYLRQAKVPPTRIRSWLFTIMKNRYLDIQRSRKTWNYASTLPETLPAPEIDLERWRLVDDKRLWQAVRGLDARFGTVCALYLNG